MPAVSLPWVQLAGGGSATLLTPPAGHQAAPGLVTLLLGTDPHSSLPCPRRTSALALLCQAVRGDLKRHYAAAALGVGAFFAEDLVMYSGWGGYVHSGGRT